MATNLQKEEERIGALAARAAVRHGASFRDPAGHVVEFDGRLYRVLTARGRDDLAAFTQSAAGQHALATGAVVGTIPVDSPPFAVSSAAAAVVEHTRVPFVSYPYEWSPDMLHAAAKLTLDLAESLVPEGLGLKDATPYNVLFDGPRPIFVDITSFERRHPLDSTWLPYAQFVRTFLLPLLAAKRFGLPLDRSLLPRREGLTPEDVYAVAGPVRRLMPTMLSLATVPTWLSRLQRTSAPALYRSRHTRSETEARFILKQLFRHACRKLRAVAPQHDAESQWSRYENTADSSYVELKSRFVRESVRAVGARTVLDIGCNAGTYSLLAAESGARVVGIDQDPVVAGAAWRRAREARLDVLPLVVDVARPSGAVGWDNGECASFFDRARGSFDTVLMLAVVHHLQTSELVSFARIVDLAANLTTDAVVIEFVDPSDAAFHRLVRGRETLFAGHDQAAFESACRRRFRIVESAVAAGGTRRLYLLRK